MLTAAKDVDATMPRKDKIRYLTFRAGPAGELPRYYWQPSAKLVAEGWLMQRVPLNWEHYSDPDDLYGAAASRAIVLNRELDQVRAGNALAMTRPAEPVKRRTIDALIRLYRAHDDYRDLSPKTRINYDTNLDKIGAWSGEFVVRALDRKRIDNWRKSLSGSPAACNAAMRVLRLLLNFAASPERDGGAWIAVNPAAKMKLAGLPVSGRIWPRQAVDLFVDTADAGGLFSIGTAIVLDEWLGQREADILSMPRTVYRDGRLIFRQAKGTSLRKGTQGAGVVLGVDDVPVLFDRLAAQLARNDAAHAALKARGLDRLIPLNIVQSEETRRPYLARNFAQVFDRLRRLVEARMLTDAGWFQQDNGSWVNQAVEQRLGNYPKADRAAERARAQRDAASFEIDYLLPGRDPRDADAFRLYVGQLQFMHLRHTAITRLAEAGCSHDEIAAVSGHSLKTVQQILERYLFRTAALSRTAFAKRLAKDAGDQAEKETADG